MKTTYVLLVLVAALCLAAAPPTSAPPSCALYDDSPVGVVCFHGDDLTSAIATGGTGWLVEFYSGWCGHCQHFAPTWKQLGKDVAGWSSVVKLGVIDCSGKTSYSTCTDYNIRAYPTIRFFQPRETDPKASSDNYHGSRKMGDIQEAIIGRLQSWEGPSAEKWPHFNPLEGDHLLTIPAAEWAPVALVFEEKDSFIGRKLMLDLLDLKRMRVYRSLATNLVLVNHYSIMDFPSLVIETRKDDYIVVPGHSMEDPGRDFAEAIRKHFRNIPRTLSTSAPSSLPPSLPPHTPGYQDTSHNPGLQHRTTTYSTAFRYNRVSPVDVLGAISYIFRREVPLHSTVAGPAFPALFRFIHLLEEVLARAYPAAVPSLSLVRARLETKLSAGFITARDWTRLLDTKLNESLFPLSPEWANCRGSQSHYRGYPCALWTLSHTLTLLTLPISTHEDIPPSPHPPSFRSKEALKTISHFIANFFSCEHCREHFSAMSRSLGEGRVVYDGDAVLWLWEAHNRVNRRLAKDVSSDPLFPKTLFPSPNRCPYCYTGISAAYSPRVGGATTPKTTPKPTWSNTGFRSSSESLLSPPDLPGNRQNLLFTWNRTAVLLYLWSYYHWNHTHFISHRQILEAAWPNMFSRPRPLHLGPGSRSPGMGMNRYDMGLCVTYYILCGGLMVAVGYWLLRRRLRQYRHFLHP